MSDPDATAFLSEAAGWGATVVVVGATSLGLCAALAAAVGPVGLVVVCAARRVRGCAEAASLRAVPAFGIPVLSHAADAMLLAEVSEADEPDIVAEEARRLLAPSGVLRALASPEEVEPVAIALGNAGFRDVEIVPLGGVQGIRARGPRRQKTKP